MEWWVFLTIIFCAFIILMLSGLPVAFCFLLINIVSVYMFWGGLVGLEQLVLSIFESVTFFAMLPVPLFLLMGEVLFHSGMGTRIIDALDTLMGRLPGRLSLVAVASGVLIAVLCGNTWASTAMLGSMLVPEMVHHTPFIPNPRGPASIKARGILARLRGTVITIGGTVSPAPEKAPASTISIPINT